ncbi:hypothetical protein [Streptomyces sp. NPDC047315]|uniref:hypothetical protein n=1 Tax=Streptomyces sp. NPDC047315 TaxID=3155142 RepID=UPI0033CF56AA
MRFRPNRNGINKLMRLDGSGAAVRRAADRIAASAGDGFRTDSALGRRRWRAAVIGNYLKHRDAEGTRTKLLRGLDGGEG